MQAVKIGKLRLKNFKSFRKAVIPFSKGFTTIAGSNGSGKSNILDAIMFVLGMTSLKMMRASKLVDLVNNDAKEDYALVEIELKQKDKNYVLSRTIDKQGKSVYRIEGKRSTLNETTSLLNELGISASGYNIVVQGDVTRIIEMNSTQRREIIDDLAGLTEFDEKKDESLKELEKVNTKTKEINIVLKERETYLDELEKEKKAATEHKELTKEFRQAKATIIRKEIKKIKDSMQENTAKIEKIGEKKDAMEKQKKEAEEEEKKLQEKTEEINNRIIESKEKTYSGVGMEIEEKKSEKKILEEKIESKKEQISRLKNRIHSITEKQAKSRERQDEMKKSLETIKEKIDGAKESLTEKEKQAEKEQERINSIKEKINETEKELEEKNSVLEKEKEKYYSRKSETEKFEKEIKMHSGFLKEIQEDINNQKLKQKAVSLKETEKKLKEMEKELSEENEKPEIREKILKLKKIKEKLEREVKEILKTLDELASTEREERIEKEKDKAESLLEETRKEKEKINELLEKIKKEKEETKKELNELKEEVLLESNLMQEVNRQKMLLKELEIKRDSINESLKEKEETKSDSGNEIQETEEEIAETEKKISETEEKITETEKKIKSLTIELEKQNKQSHVLYEEKEKIMKKINEVKERKTKNESSLAKIFREENEARIDNSKNEVRTQDLEEELTAFSEETSIEGKELGELKERLVRIEKRINELGAVNLKAIDSFEGQTKELIEIRDKARKLDEERIAVLDMIEKIEIKRATAFMDCFNEINSNFKKMYFSLAEKEGTLKLTNEADTMNSGLLIEAKYDSEKMINIDSMSGGEKTLTALAFLFSIQLFRPAPFYIFDEADAALDQSNSLKLSKMITEICKKSQFIAITHNDSLIKESDQIIGVALNKQKSSVIGLKLKEKLEEQAEENAGMTTT
ncbi:MAG: AAA family ATPase [archaeon]